MKLVMTLLVRNEADVVDAQLAYHLHAGVDFVMPRTTRSSDGTTEILERYERAGRLRLFREEADDMRQAEWVTRMARLAATEHGADWVVNADADEFWWPRGGSLKDVPATVPARYGVLRGCWRHFLPRPDDESFFAERTTVRLAAPAIPGDKETVFHAHGKVGHRAHPEVEIEAGNHNAEASGLDPLRAWHPLEVLHFSFRSVAQLQRKAHGGWLRNRRKEPTLHQIRCDEASLGGRVGRSTTLRGRRRRARARSGRGQAPSTRACGRVARASRRRRDVRVPRRGPAAGVSTPERRGGRRVRGGGISPRRDRRNRPRRAARRELERRLDVLEQGPLRTTLARR